MTAALAQGDAIGNYIISLDRLLRGWGGDVRLYADYLNPRYPLAHAHSGAYRPTGDGILWLHYSLASDSADWAAATSDYVILDYHGICPPRLFHGYDPLMERLCAHGIERLPALVKHADLAIGHSAYARDELRALGARMLCGLPLVVDTTRFNGAGDPAWEPLLSKLDYLLFVGRIVPQKGLARALELFAALAQRRPDLKLFLAGARHLPAYAEELEALAERLGIAEHVVFTGPVTDPATLTSLFRHARFYLCLSEWESFCVPIVEALHFGTPVLGWAVPPIPETMGPGGVLLEGSITTMAAQIDALWEDRDCYQALRAAGQAHARQFTDVALSHGLLALLSGLAEGL